MDVRARVARNLRRLRVEAGLSQEAFAVDAGLDRTYVSRIERHLENPTIGVVQRIAQALGVDIVEMVSEPQIKDRLPSLRPGRKTGSRRR